MLPAICLDCIIHTLYAIMIDTRAHAPYTHITSAGLLCPFFAEEVKGSRDN